MTNHGNSPSPQEIAAFGGPNPDGVLMISVSPNVAPQPQQADPSNIPGRPNAQTAPVPIVAGNQLSAPAVVGTLAPEATPVDQGQKPSKPKLRSTFSRSFQYGVAKARSRAATPRQPRKRVSRTGSTARRQGSPATPAPSATPQTLTPTTPNQQPATQTPNTAPNPQTPDTELPKADWEVRRDLFVELESARDEYINATVAGRVGSTKKTQKRYEAATEKYTDVRDRAIQLHAQDMLSSGKTMDDVKESITTLFIKDTHENEELVSEAMLAKANEAQAIITETENPDMSTLKGMLGAGKELVYKMWTEGAGEKLLSKAGFKNRWKRSAITTTVTFAPGVAVGAVAATLAAPIIGVAGVGAITLGIGAAARGALRGGVNEFINRRAEEWRQPSVDHPAISSAEEMREQAVSTNAQLAHAYSTDVIDELGSDLLVSYDKGITLDFLEQARAKERQANKALRRKIGVFAVSSVLGVGVGAALRWGAGEVVEHASQWLQGREFRLPFSHGNDLPSMSSTPNTTEAVTTTTNTTTPTTQAPTSSTTPTTSTPTTTVPESTPTIPSSPPATPVPGELPSPSTLPGVDTSTLDRINTLAKLAEIKADPAKSAAFDRMVSDPYAFGKLQNAVTELQIQNPGMSQAEIEQLTMENLDRVHQQQIGQYLLGMKALEDESGLKVGTKEFDNYAANKINQISDAEFAPTKSIIDTRINSSSLDSIQKSSLQAYAHTDSLNNYQNGYATMNQTIADSKRIGLSPAEINHAIVQNMAVVNPDQVNSLLSGYDEDEVAEMLGVYYGIAA